MKKRILYFITGVPILALGLTLNTKSVLGISAINATPYALSQAFPLTLGNFVTIMYVLFILIQMIALKKISLQIIAQFPFSIVFGYLVDFFQNMLPIAQGLVLRFVFLFLGILVTSLGAALMVRANLVLNPADGMVSMLSQKLGESFGTCKNYMDIAMCLIAAAVCLLTGTNVLDTIGIGTLLSALLIGRVIAYLQKTVLLDT